MPLRDHFGPPLDRRHSWDALHGGWPMMIVESMATSLSPEYIAAPLIRLGDAEIDEYEVRVYNVSSKRRLVAAIELVNPSIKNRPEVRRLFVAKCAALLQQQVSVTIVDVVTTRESNLYVELLEFLGQKDPTGASPPSHLYAVSCRRVTSGQQSRFEAWHQPLIVGQTLPTLPLWIAEDQAVPLDLESSYQETCRSLRIG